MLFAAAVFLASAAGPGRRLSAVLIGLPQLAAAGAVALRGVSPRGGPRAAWSLMGFGMVAYASTSVFYIANPNAAASFPGIGDLSILTYPSMLAALVLFWRIRAPGTPPWSQLDAGVAGLAVAALGEWVLVAAHIEARRPRL